MTTAKNPFDVLLAYSQEMIDFHQAEMEVSADDSLEFYLAAGAHNAWVLIHAKLLALETEALESDTERTNSQSSAAPPMKASSDERLQR